MHPSQEEHDGRTRELIEPNEGDKRYVRRDENGQFTDDQVDVGRSLSQDQKQQAKTKVKSGQGDKGDRWHRSLPHAERPHRSARCGRSFVAAGNAGWLPAAALHDAEQLADGRLELLVPARADHVVLVRDANVRLRLPVLEEPPRARVLHAHAGHTEAQAVQ
jgi:hypothetical protein